MRIATSDNKLLVETKEVTMEDGVIYCSTKEDNKEDTFITSSDCPNEEFNDQNTIILGSYVGCPKLEKDQFDIASEVMVWMIDYFELIPDGVFRMPTQEEIEDRIYDGEDDEE